MRTRRSSRANPVPGNIPIALEALKIHVDRIQDDEAWALCPNPRHDDRRANNWSINLETGKHSCFACGYRGLFVDLVRTLTGADDEGARSWVRKHGGIEHAVMALRGDDGKPERKEAEPITEADLALFDDPPDDALDRRDVTDVACRAFGVRYAPDTDRWVFPVRDPFTDELRGWQEKGRSVFLNQPKELVKRDCLFGWDVYKRNRNGRTVILVESPIDAVRLWSYGVDGAVSSFGAVVSAEQVTLIVEEADTLIVFMDNDEGGRASEHRVYNLAGGRIRLKFFNYEMAGWEDDPGDLDLQQIEWGIDNAIPFVVA